MNSWHSHEPEADSITVQLTTVRVQVKPKEEVDKRYRILVMLQRSDRPNYWTFNCPHCKTPVFEITNAEVESMSDLVGVGTSDDVLLGSRCDGPYCRYYYYFKLSGVN